MISWLSLALAAVGHTCLIVLAVNVFHGIGIRETRMSWAKPIFLLGLGLWSLAILYFAWTGGWSTWPFAIRIYGWLCVLTAGIGLPIVTVLRSLRRPPDGVKTTRRVVDLTAGRDRNDLIGHGPDSWWLRLPGNQAFEFEFLEIQLPLPSLPEALDGLSILHLSDLHLTPAYDRRFFEALIDQVEALEADLVVFTGDLIDDEEHLSWVEPLLSRVRGRLGQFGILGNHDYRHDINRALDALSAAGFEPVEAAWRSIPVSGRTIAIGGTSAPWGEWPNAEPSAELRILLCHSPDGLYRAARDAVDLVLSGHTHGGQYRLPIFGPIIMPSIFSRRFDGGFFVTRQTTMYVSRGIAGQHPLRFNCRPEVTRLILRSPARASLHRTHFETRREGVEPIEKV
jgi:uncharacterized protein